ncbi:MAG: cobalamin-independent methionine synthase II family protein [Candidatus Calescibacterium sp.]|nr:cobalamin-independent methionine synthase II family protein [Candidatus Calescibacterium sp.]MCX7972719.1 cobalamin-independent methionine synthase II family protein [bacterium]MDW8195523.1 cobalamin-independent methionine synthase II family protein [Candidatus Calescibacterium sp.]
MIVTHEIGSLSKPSWRVKPFRNLPLTEEDLNQAIKWAKRLNISDETEELIEIVKKNLGNPNLSDEEKQKIVFYSSLYAVRFLENVGIDLVYDGEQHRSEMYEYPIRNIQGFEFKGHVRSFDNKYYRKASLVSKPILKDYYHRKETQTIKSFIRKKLKIPVTGPYTLVDWSFDEYYYSVDLFEGETKKHRRKFLKEMGQIIRQVIQDIIDNGADFIQIDEPAATTKKDEVELFVDTIYDTLVGLQDKSTFSIHICFSNYSILFPYIEKLDGIVKELHFEYANRDSWELGRKNRKGYEILKMFKNNNFTVGLGVLDVHTDRVESKELIKDRILYAMDIVGDRIYVAPDCGLRTRTWEIAYQKLSNMVEAVKCIN